jgi:hypothetical protein
MNKRKERKNV